MRMNALGFPLVRRFNVQHRVERTDLRMPGDYGATECALERREAHGTLSIALEHELDAVSAKAAGAVVQQNRSDLVPHAAYGVAAAGRRMPSPRWKNPGSDTGLMPPIGARPEMACAAAFSSASPTPNVTR